MAKVQVELPDNIYNIGEEIAFKNKLKPSKVKVNDLLIKIALDCIKYLDDEDFQQLTGLKK